MKMYSVFILLTAMLFLNTKAQTKADAISWLRSKVPTINHRGNLQAYSANCNYHLFFSNISITTEGIRIAYFNQGDITDNVDIMSWSELSNVMFDYEMGGTKCVYEYQNSMLILMSKNGKELDVLFNWDSEPNLRERVKKAFLTIAAANGANEKF